MSKVTARYITAALWRWIWLLGFWVLLIGIGWIDLIAGGLAAGLATWASLLLLQPSKHHTQYTALLKLAGRFVYESVLGGADVAYRAFHPKLPLHTGFIRYPVQLPAGSACNIFTAFTSALPGTLPVGTDAQGALVYHCLDTNQPIAAQMSIDEQLLSCAIGETDEHD